VDVERFHRVGACVFAPQAHRQALGAHGLVRVQEQHCQQRAGLRAAERHHVAAGADLERAKDPELHLVGERPYSERRRGRKQNASLLQSAAATVAGMITQLTPALARTLTGERRAYVASRARSDSLGGQVAEPGRPPIRGELLRERRALRRLLGRRG
jgi:hypothetical protein